MRIAIISDTHDNIWKLETAMPHLASSDVILHCGDLCSPFVVKQIGEGVGGIPVHIVWGNNDGDKILLSKIAGQAGNIHIHGEFADLEFDGTNIAMTHYPEIGNAIAQSEKFDLVCYGHEHTRHQEVIGNTTLLNPGEVMGLNGRSTIAILQLPSWDIEWIDLE